ncbi:MAG: FMN-binding protein [Elusimicrobia bacterium CG_4_9_14_3_um_filter_62_55]|nr:MAG: FMN-binding protein [Elusimicrobia bacterium CG22_combo_CG10-13_8_21_14_all_63_91]PJA13703.1 MAG: FMN-binding protein [Elusimicrobia bacterium CG_4_10_14_0_2_um_filter_63_34]PJB23176.1 MAG: FMN-binding protein [Elusimicrobia bacterium CG_4_9_14_3_um_filter_62_55]
MIRFSRILAMSVLVLSATSGQGQARLLLSRKEALGLAFPADAVVEKKNAFLSKEDLTAVQREARAPVDSRLWTYFVAESSGRVVGYAYFDRVVIRTMPATVMAAISPEGSLRFLEVLSFDEPEDYLPLKRWLKLFEGKADPQRVRVGDAIRNVTGATLTSHALTDAARRLLGLHRTLHPTSDNER